MADAEYARFESMTNAELRTELKRRNCPISGNKKDLLAKLRVAIQKEYEQQTSHSVGYPQHETPVTYINLPIHDQIQNQYASVYDLSVPQNANPVIAIPILVAPVEQEEISVTPEKKTRTRSKKPSVESPSQEIPQSQSINNEQIILDISNNVEANTFVSKSSEEEEKTIENIGEETHLPSIGSSSSAKSESVIKEIPSFDEQQRLNPSEINTTSDETKNEVSKPVELPSEIIEQQETGKENDVAANNNEAEKPPVIRSRSHISSVVKISNRSTINKINLTSELLRTLISDLSLLPEYIVTDELDSEDNNDSIVETSVTNDYHPSNSMTIGELADQKQPTNRTVAIDDPSTRKKVNSIPTRFPSFESKTNDIITDEPVRIKDPTTTTEPPSEILYIRGLTRPFTPMQLKGLLNRYGRLIEGEFWLDKIKSQCFATYRTLEEARNAREGLDGCRWPSTNPKTLSVRFARQEEFEYSKTHDLPPDHMSTDSTDRVVEESTSPVNETGSKNDSDQLKVQKSKPSGFLITDEDEDEQAVKTNEQPMKSLDDYFHKTKAKPSIYWLPLSEEQILENIRRQEQRNAERDEEQRKRDADGNVRKSDKRKRSVSPLKGDSKRH